MKNLTTLKRELEKEVTVRIEKNTFTLYIHNEVGSNYKNYISFLENIFTKNGYEIKTSTPIFSDDLDSLIITTI